MTKDEGVLLDGRSGRIIGKFTLDQESGEFFASVTDPEIQKKMGMNVITDWSIVE